MLRRSRSLRFRGQNIADASPSGLNIDHQADLRTYRIYKDRELLLKYHGTKTNSIAPRAFHSFP